MENQRAKELLDRYEKGLCNPDERAIVESWFIKELSEQKDELPEPDYLLKEREIFQRLPGTFEKSKTRYLIPRLSAAAILVLALSIGLFFYYHHPEPEIKITKNDLEPGTNKAVLTIGDGQRIVLTGAHNGKLAVQGNMVIDKAEDGKIVYQAAGDTDIKNTSVVYNTMTTPRGGKYDLVLSDGTKVWLDAASSITYPTSFPGKDREVSVTGQVYFEVEHNALKPFRVKSGAQTVEVLGTHFNINAYDDEPSLRTTLLEGRVKVSRGAASAILKPGQQAIISPATDRINVAQASIEQATAWKDGHFHFESDDVKAVMRQLARWYDVDVEYVGNIPPRAISGDIDRNSKASVALQILTILNIHSKIEGKKIIITP